MATRSFLTALQRALAEATPVAMEVPSTSRRGALSRAAGRRAVRSLEALRRRAASSRAGVLVTRALGVTKADPPPPEAFSPREACQPPAGLPPAGRAGAVASEEHRVVDLPAGARAASPLGALPLLAHASRSTTARVERKLSTGSAMAFGRAPTTPATDATRGPRLSPARGAACRGTAATSFRRASWRATAPTAQAATPRLSAAATTSRLLSRFPPGRAGAVRRRAASQTWRRNEHPRQLRALLHLRPLRFQ